MQHRAQDPLCTKKHCSVQWPCTEGPCIAMFLLLISHRWWAIQCAILSLVFWPLYILFLLFKHYLPPYPCCPTSHLPTTSPPAFLWLTPTASGLDVISPGKFLWPLSSWPGLKVFPVFSHRAIDWAIISLITLHSKVVIREALKPDHLGADAGSTPYRLGGLDQVSQVRSPSVTLMEYYLIGVQFPRKGVALTLQTRKLSLREVT